MNNSVVLDIDPRGVATVTLNRPEKHNAFDDVIIAELTTIFTKINANQNAKVMVLAANGKSFSAGGDLNWMKRMINFTYDENIADAKKLAVMLETLNSLSIPTIARVQGAAFGGAVGLVSCCDASAAKALGLVSEVTQSEELDERVNKFVEDLLANSPNAVQVSKQLISDVEHRTIDEELMNYTSETIARLRVSNEGQEGLNSFFEKRAPSWQKQP